MKQIDWTKPIETIAGTSATLLRVLERKSQYKNLIVFNDDGEEKAICVDDEGFKYWTTPAQPLKVIRNVAAEPLRLYGVPDKPHIMWTRARSILDTHVIELTEEDLKRVMRPLKDGE